MTPWVALYDAHRNLRAQGPDALTDLRRVLRTLSEQSPKLLADGAQARLQPSKNSKGRIKIYCFGADIAEELAIAKLPKAQKAEASIEKARLTVLLSLDTGAGHLHELTIMVEGTRSDKTPWTLAIHLSDDRATERNADADRQGHGACGHAALHCHIGPTLDIQPKVRVPLPALPAGDLLAWLISQVVPTLPFEPAPWPMVLDALHIQGS